MATKSQAIKTWMLQWLWFSLIVIVFILWVFLAKAARTNTNPTSWQWDPSNLYSSWDDTLTSAKWNALVEKVENNVWSSGQFWNIVTTYVKNTTYQASQDWFILAYCNWPWRTRMTQSINSNLSSPIINFESQDEINSARLERTLAPVKKNYYRKYEVLRNCWSPSIFFFPLN